VDDTVAKTLARLLSQKSREEMFDPRRCEGYLRDHCPAAKDEIAALVRCLAAKCPQRLAGTAPADRNPAAIDHHAGLLAPDSGLPQGHARWAVAAWAQALGWSSRPAVAATSFDVSAFLDRAAIGSYRLLIFGLCTLAMTVDGYDVFVVGYVLPSMASDFGVPITAITSIFVVQTIALGVGAYVVSPFADRIGRRTVILICMALLGIFTFLGTLATSVLMLAVLRCVASFFFGAVVPNLVALTSEYCSRRSRAILVIILFMGYTIGAGGGGSIASALAASYGWRSAFVLGGLVPLAVAGLLFFLLPESIRFLVQQGNRVADVVKRLRNIDPSLDLAGVQVFTIDEPRTGEIPFIALFLDGRAAGTLLLWLSFAMNLFVLTLIASWMPAFLRVFAGVDIRTAGSIAALFSLGGIISPLVLGWLMNRYGPTRVLAVNYLAAGISIVFIGLWSANPALAGLAVFCAGLFVVGGQGGINALASMLYPTEMRATGIGWALGAGRVSSVFGPLLGGLLLGARWSGFAILAAASVPAFVAALATLLLRFKDDVGLAPRPAIAGGTSPAAVFAKDDVH
jgi:AAHS family 4-hydroxybenzoate transporter-like MFS transporter